MKRASVVLTTVLFLALSAAGTAHAAPPDPAGPETELCKDPPPVTVAGHVVDLPPICIPWPW